MVTICSAADSGQGKAQLARFNKDLRSNATYLMEKVKKYQSILRRGSPENPSHGSSKRENKSSHQGSLSNLNQKPQGLHSRNQSLAAVEVRPVEALSHSKSQQEILSEKFQRVLSSSLANRSDLSRFSGHSFSQLPPGKFQAHPKPPGFELSFSTSLYDPRSPKGGFPASQTPAANLQPGRAKPGTEQRVSQAILIQANEKQPHPSNKNEQLKKILSSLHAPGDRRGSILSNHHQSSQDEEEIIQQLQSRQSQVNLDPQQLIGNEIKGTLTEDIFQQQIDVIYKNYKLDLLRQKKSQDNSFGKLIQKNIRDKNDQFHRQSLMSLAKLATTTAQRQEQQPRFRSEKDVTENQSRVASQLRHLLSQSSLQHQVSLRP